MAQYNYAPQVEFFGDLRVSSAGSDNSSVARRGDVAGLSFISAIASDSQNMLSVSNGELSVDSLLITDVTVDTTYTTLAAWISNGIPSGFKKGDIVILTAADPSLSYISKVESPAAASDFALLNDGNTYSAGNGITLSGSVFSADVTWLQTDTNVFTAGNGISNSSGTLAIDAAWARVDGNIFTAGTGITNSSGTLAVALTGGTGIGVSGAEISFNGDSDDVSEGSSNQYFTQARSRSSVSVASVSSPDTQLLSYNNGTGVFSIPASDVFAQFSGSDGISFSNGDISFSGDSDDVPEGSVNEYFTQARARGSISAGTGISYNSGTGAVSLNISAGDGIEINGGNEIAVNLSVLRYSASNVSLTANTAYTVTHNLGMKLVHVSALRTSDSARVELEVVYSSTSALTIKSVSNLTVDIAVSV